MSSQGDRAIQEVTQAILAVGTVAGAFAMGFVLLARGASPADLPGWVEITLGGVIGFYFGQKGTATGIAAATDGPVAVMTSLVGRHGPRWTDPQPPTTPMGGPT